MGRGAVSEHLPCRVMALRSPTQGETKRLPLLRWFSDLPEQGPPPKASWRSKQKIQGSSRMFVTGQREKRVGAALVPGLEGDKAGDPPSPGNRFPAANSGGLFQCFLLLVAVVGGVAAVEGVRFTQN